jgi:hypothetical protein
MACCIPSGSLLVPHEIRRSVALSGSPGAVVAAPVLRLNPAGRTMSSVGELRSHADPLRSVETVGRLLVSNCA